jgi:hypothetical protein
MDDLFADPSDSRFELLNAQYFCGPRFITASRDTAYCTFDPGLVILDIGDPENPQMISETLLEESPTDIVLIEKTAIMRIAYGGLTIVDVSDSQNPQVVGEYLEFEHLLTMTNQDSIVYLLYRGDPGNPDGMVILNFSDPLHPQVLGIFEQEADFENITVQDDRAFISARREGLLIVDIGDPSTPTLVTSYPPPDNKSVANCVVRDSLIYLGITTLPAGMIQILSINSQDSLSLIAELDEEVIPMDAMTLVQEFLYLDVSSISSSGNIQILDVSDPTSPVIDTTIAGFTQSRQLYLYEDLLFVPHSWYGLEIWGVEAPGDPYVRGYYNTKRLSSVDVDSTYAYIARYQDELYICSIEDPGEPELISTLEIDGYMEDILVRGDYLYLANRDKGMQIFDVSDPYQPQWISQYKDSTSDSWALTLRDTLLFIADNELGMEIINITDPYSPSLVSSFRPSVDGYVESIALGGNYAYIANYRGIVAADISDPYNPVEVAVYNDEENRKLDVLYHNNLIYYADYHVSEFYIRDVSDPYNSELTYQGWPGATIFGEDYFLNFPILFSADHLINALNINDPQSPFLFDHFGFAHTSVDLAGSDTLLYSVGNSFVIVDFDRTGLGIDNDLPSLSLPKVFSLSQNYPNPFNPSTTIEFSIPEGEAAQTCLNIYDIRGRLIRILINEEKNSGRYSVHWDGKDEIGREVGSGIYFYRITIEDYTSTKKMVLLR